MRRCCVPATSRPPRGPSASWSSLGFSPPRDLSGCPSSSSAFAGAAGCGRTHLVRGARRAGPSGAKVAPRAHTGPRLNPAAAGFRPRQPRHSPATVSRRSGNTAGRCAPSKRWPLTSPTAMCTTSSVPAANSSQPRNLAGIERPAVRLDRHDHPPLEPLVVTLDRRLVGNRQHDDQRELDRPRTVVAPRRSRLRVIPTASDALQPSGTPSTETRTLAVASLAPDRHRPAAYHVAGLLEVEAEPARGRRNRSEPQFQNRRQGERRPTGSRSSIRPMRTGLSPSAPRTCRRRAQARTRVSSRSDFRPGRSGAPCAADQVRTSAPCRLGERARWRRTTGQIGVG